MATPTFDASKLVRTSLEGAEKGSNPPADTPNPDDGGFIPLEPLVGLEWAVCARCTDEYKPSALRMGVCPWCRDSEEQARSYNRRRDDELKSLDVSFRAMVGEKAWNEFRLDTYKPKTVTQSEALKMAWDFAYEKENLFIAGPTGVGKSHLAVGIARRFYRSMLVEFIKATNLMRKFRGRIEVREELAMLEHYANLPVLVIDDFGVGRDSEHSNQIVYEIIDRRMDNYKKGLIVTSNMGLTNLAKKMGEDRTTSRLNGICRRVYIDGPDHRGERGSADETGTSKNTTT